MESNAINPVDLAVLALVLVSGAFAFFRGFVREVLAVAGWIGAGFVTLYLFPHVQPYARAYISPTVVADAAAGVALFVAALVVFSLVSHAIAGRVRDSALSPLDRSLGFVFGLARGAVVAAIGYLLLSWMWPAAEHPPWLRDARSRPLLAEGGELLLTLLPEQAEQRARSAVDTGVSRGRDALDAQRMLERLTVPPMPPSSHTDSDRESGYKGDERRALDNLFRNSQGR